MGGLVTKDNSNLEEVFKNAIAKEKEITFEEKYNQELQQFDNIYNGLETLTEEDITGAFNLAKESIQAYNRWSYIKYDIKKDLKRGQLTATKERLEEMCTYLKHVYTFTKSIWLKAREDLRSQ